MVIHQSQGDMIHFFLTRVHYSAPNHWSQSTGTCNPPLQKKRKKTLWNHQIISPSHTLPSKPMKFPRVEHQPLTIPIITISSKQTILTSVHEFWEQPYPCWRHTLQPFTNWCVEKNWRWPNSKKNDVPIAQVSHRKPNSIHIGWDPLNSLSCLKPHTFWDTCNIIFPNLIHTNHIFSLPTCGKLLETNK